MKKIFLMICLIFACAAAFFCFTKYNQKSLKEYSFINNKNHEYVFAIIQSSAEEKKKNYLSNFYSDKRKLSLRGDTKCRRGNPVSLNSFLFIDEKILIENYNNLLKKNKRINPVTRSEIYSFLGNIYAKNDDFANAVYCYKKALFFAPYNTEIKYNIKNFVNFVEKTNVPEKLLEHNNENSIKQLQYFIQNKKNLLNKQIEDTKVNLKDIYFKNIKLNENIKLLTDKNKDNLKKEIVSVEKEKENTEKQIKTLKEKATKQEISEIQNIKKELLKSFPTVSQNFADKLIFWEKTEKSIVKRISKNLKTAETKTLQDKYFYSDLFLHKKNIWKNLLEDFQQSDKIYGSVVERNINFINYKNVNIFNELNDNEKQLFKEIIETDKKVNLFFNRRAVHLFEEKNNISYLLKDVSSKKKEIYSDLSSVRASNEQKKKNLQKELDKIKEKEKALRQESTDCSKDLAEIEIIQDNILMYNEINLLEIKNDMLAKYIDICKKLQVVCEYIKMFSEKQKGLLNTNQDILKNIKTFDYPGLKKYSESLDVCDENFSNMITEQKYLFDRQKLLLSNYSSLINEIKQNIESSDDAEKGEVFNNLKVFIDKEQKFLTDKENNLNKSFEYDKIYSLQNDIRSADLTAKKKIENLEDILEKKSLMENFFPEQKPAQKKTKNKKHQEKVIVSKMKNYEVNTETVQEEVKDVSSSKKEKKKKKKKK